MSEPGKVTRLYLARWPDGTATIFSAECFEHAVDRIDEVGDASACEVVPLEDVWLTVQPSDDPKQGPLRLSGDPTSEIDSQREIMSLAFPVLSKLVEATDPSATGENVDPELWRQRKEIEANRILSPSPRLKEAIADWWSNLVPPDSD